MYNISKINCNSPKEGFSTVFMYNISKINCNSPKEGFSTVFMYNISKINCNSPKEGFWIEQIRIWNNATNELKIFAYFYLIVYR